MIEARWFSTVRWLMPRSAAMFLCGWDRSGIYAVEEIRRTGPVPHLFVSGDTSRLKALRPDAVVMQEPFRESDLARAILKSP